MLIHAGCLNGGGQIKPKPGQSPKELIKSLEVIYMENVSKYFCYEFSHLFWKTRNNNSSS